MVADGDATGMSHVYLAEVSDVIGPFVDTGFGTGADTACLEKRREPFPCQDWGFSFAPDGERVVLLQTCTYNGMLVDRWADSTYIPGCEFLTILDLRTGELTELSETIQQRRDEGLLGLDGSASLPAWSVDGSMIAFVRGLDRLEPLHHQRRRHEPAHGRSLGFAGGRAAMVARRHDAGIHVWQRLLPGSRTQ